ncbi:MAG: histidine phosphatase family protein [Myxococcales bacterium]|nr:histidine phosphatase family protein [Myxococcales bacterium]
MRAWWTSLVLVVACGGRTHAPDCPSVAELTAPEPRAQTEGELEADVAGPVEPAVILLVRHAEKAADGTPDPPLTARGVERAECLAQRLSAFGPTHLLATQYQRTAATLQPLARATGLEIVVIEAQDHAGWARALAELPPGARAVVAGHSNTLPGLVAALGGRLEGLDAKGNIPDDDYDRLVHMVRHEPGRATSYTTAYCAQ